jgi:hypothetical protein
VNRACGLTKPSPPRDEDLLRFWQSLDDDDIVGMADYSHACRAPATCTR